MKISENAKIGNDVIIKAGVIIEDDVFIGDGCYLDYGCIIRNNVKIMDNCYVGPYCILGEFNYDFYRDKKNKCHPLSIGNNAIIRSHTVIYGDTDIGYCFQTGHNVVIREKTTIGNNSRVGTQSDIQNNCIIGNYVSIHSKVFVAPDAMIHDYVWLMPGVVLTNDPTPPSEQSEGVIIESYAVVAARATILPGVIIHKNSLIGAGSVVTKDVTENVVVVGNPAKCLCKNVSIKNHTTRDNAYPWPYYFKRGFPWQDTGYELWLQEND